MNTDTFQPAQRPDDWRHVEIELGASPKDCRIQIDGRGIGLVHRLTLTIAAGDTVPARLTLVRTATPIRESGGELVRTVEEYEPGPGHTIDVRGIVQLIEDAGRTSVVMAGDKLEALHTFMIGAATQGDGEKVHALADVIRDADRWRALERVVDVHGHAIDCAARDFGGLVAVADNQLDDERRELATPRLPT